jgi:hypothetical protein
MVQSAADAAAAKETTNKAAKKFELRNSKFKETKARAFLAVFELRTSNFELFLFLMSV